MIARLRGSVVERTEDGVVLDVAGVGYEVALGASAVARLPPDGQEVRLFVVESTAMYGGGTTLYGFLSEDERRLFDVFRDHIPNTGAKKALELLDKALKSLPDFHRAVATKSPAALVGLFGFTAKTAEKLVVALQGKLDATPLAAPGAPPADNAFEEAVAGLVALGYREPNARAAAEAARAARGAEGSPQDLIRDALGRLVGRS